MTNSPSSSQPENGSNRDPSLARIFVAVELGEDVRSSLRRMQNKLKETGARVRWVKPENMHLTLVFMGWVFTEGVEQVRSVMDGIAGEHGAFSLTITGAGFFGSPSSPRVLWVGVEESRGILMPLQADLTQALRDHGFKMEDREFKPHLTLGRVKSSRGAGGLTTVLASDKNTLHGEVDIDRIILFRSHLESRGVHYTKEHESILKGAGAHGS